MERFGDGAFPLLALFVASAAMLAAQDASQSGSQQNPYQGVSHPPADDTIVTTSIPEAKPPAGQPLNPSPAAEQPATQPAHIDPAAANPPVASAPYAPQPAPVDHAANYAAPEAVDGTDDGIVRIAPTHPTDQPALNQREYANDPHGDAGGDPDAD